MCASYHLDEEPDNPCHLADFVAEKQSRNVDASSQARARHDTSNSTLGYNATLG